MSKLIVHTSETFKDFVRKTTLGNEIDVPIEVTESTIFVRRKDLAMKIYGEYKAFKIVDGKVPENEPVLLGIPNAKKFIKYLTVLDGTPVLVKLLNDSSDVDKIFMFGNTSPDIMFEVVLSVLSQPDVTPLKLSDFFIDIELTAEKVKKMFEVLKLISSDECGIVLKRTEGEKWDVTFKVGSRYEDKGEVVITQVDKIPQFSSKFITQIDESTYFIKFHQQDVLATLAVLDKTDDTTDTYFRLKNNGALVLTEENDDFTIHYGFVPYV